MGVIRQPHSHDQHHGDDRAHHSCLARHRRSSECSATFSPFTDSRRHECSCVGGPGTGKGEAPGNAPECTGRRPGGKREGEVAQVRRGTGSRPRVWSHLALRQLSARVRHREVAHGSDHRLRDSAGPELEWNSGDGPDDRCRSVRRAAVCRIGSLFATQAQTPVLPRRRISFEGVSRDCLPLIPDPISPMVSLPDPGLTADDTGPSDARAPGPFDTRDTGSVLSLGPCASISAFSRVRSATRSPAEAPRRRGSFLTLRGQESARFLLPAETIWFSLEQNRALRRYIGGNRLS